MRILQFSIYRLAGTQVIETISAFTAFNNGKKMHITSWFMMKGRFSLGN